jgi:hypothetical protein
MQAQEDFLKIKMCGECDFCLFVVEKNGQFHFSVIIRQVLCKAKLLLILLYPNERVPTKTKNHPPPSSPSKTMMRFYISSKSMNIIFFCFSPQRFRSPLTGNHPRIKSTKQRFFAFSLPERSETRNPD